jgi:hypothetical protein
LGLKKKKKINVKLKKKKSCIFENVFKNFKIFKNKKKKLKK